MNDKSKRTDTASRIIKAPPQAVYRAFMNPESLIAWLPPKGMEGRIDAFDAREGGIYRMTLTYIGSDRPMGKSSDNSESLFRTSGSCSGLCSNPRIQRSPGL